ncbi:Calcitonin gene-related peptide type 1 receptor [Ooceraea biroi]|uniref:Calcitonin gene-related peptide type 1 receptor n=1 Tax=Ooceraea biroi TaxID=2015173 RepID=A0A026WP15_OOCBI|nr:Calcitonin gene-related peptide type 1 receptor [Ooceraea biroi]
MAHKYCELNGTWFRHPESNQIWSNYTTCVNMQDLSWQQGINGIYEVGYAISLVALLLSLGILTYFRSLRCARITLHMNLFSSFAINNALWLIWYRVIVANTDLLLSNGIPCHVLHVLLHYFLLTNYAWMLCEGFYLHTLLVSAFTSEHKLVNWLMGLGWPVPAVIVTLYTALRAASDDPADTEQCWINEGNYMNVLVYPVCVSTMLNLLFLFNIVRVLLMKLRAGPAIGTRPSRSMLQAFRATLLLVPLLGLHYLVIPFRPPKDHPWEHFYEVLSAITASFQGLCVAVLFCFCNGEVIAQFKRKWDGSALMRKRANSCTATTVSVRNENDDEKLLEKIMLIYLSLRIHDVRPYRASDSSVPESSPLWNVGCFSLSARPQVRWRERRRCDYQPAASAVPGEEDHKLASETRLQQPQRTVQVIAADNRPGDHGNNNHQARVLIKRGDDGSPGDDECDQTQC